MKYLAIIYILASLPVFAHGSAHRPTKEKAITPLSMDQEASVQATRADVELNEVYYKLLERAKGQKGASSKIIAAEKAWIVYRDDYIEAMYPAEDKQAEYGSMYPMEVDLLLAELTQRQTAALKELLRQYGG